MEELITIIVPIYNSEKYLKQCLVSLQEQSYHNLEIILVNDGSTDASPDICKEFCQKDARFVLIEQNNQGQGMARNNGLDCMHGEYVCFVDSDDYVHKDYVKVMYINIKDYKTDMALCNYLKFNDGEKLDNDKVLCNTCIIMNKKQMLLDISTVGPNNKSERVVMACNKMIKTEIFNGLRFQNKIHEDEFIISDYIQRVENAIWTEKVLYYYRQHADSTMGADNLNDWGHLAALDAIALRIKMFSGKEYRDIFPKILYSYFENVIIMYFLRINDNKKKTFALRIYPTYILMMLHYGYRMKFKNILRYLLFLVMPKYYHKRYWR